VSLTIYHNPRCSKSRQTLALLQGIGLEPEIILYLDTPPDVRQITQLLSQLQIDARALMRKNEDDYRSLGLDNPALSEKALIEALSSHPRLMERPIVVKDDRAVLGRPPENVLQIL
jgi:arsenate reductase